MSSSSSTAWDSPRSESTTCRPGRPTTASSSDQRVQILGISAETLLPQKTFADSLQLPYPLLSDFPDRKVIQTYGILGASQMTAQRSFFLVDEKGILRQQWVNVGGDTVMLSEPILKAVQEIKSKP